MLEKTAVVLKALGEPTRLKIIKFLSLRELCICDLVAILDMSQPRVSQHVKVLKLAGLIKERKVKQKSFFSLRAEALDGSLIEVFNLFMSSNLNDLPDLVEEHHRFLELDRNEDVIACKENLKANALNTKKAILCC